MAKRGRKYLEAAALVDRDKSYSPEEAVDLAKQTAKAKYDETVEIHMRMGLDPRHADQQVRGLAMLPNGTGKQVRVLVFAQGEAATTAEQNGADYVGADDIIKRIEGGWVEFDTAIATPGHDEQDRKTGADTRATGADAQPRAPAPSSSSPTSPRQYPTPARARSSTASTVRP